MALKYVVKKRVFGFDKTKTEKYVAQNVITNTVNFRDLCKEVSMFGMIPEGAVKHVIDALIDALNTNLNKGLSVQLGDFGCFRPGMSCKSQKEEKDVDADTVRRVKIVFTPGYKFKVIDYIITNFHLDNVSIYKTEGNGGTSSGNGGGNKPENPDEGGSGEAPDPAA